MALFKLNMEIFTLYSDIITVINKLHSMSDIHMLKTIRISLRKFSFSAKSSENCISKWEFSAFGLSHLIIIDTFATEPQILLDYTHKSFPMLITGHEGRFTILVDSFLTQIAKATHFMKFS
jgi:hypothetical protein